MYETKILEYDHLCPEAAAIRKEVFQKEQGFVNEFDETDARAMHAVLYVNGEPAGTCRYFEEQDGWHIGRLAVQKRFRGAHLGAALLQFAEGRIRARGGKIALLSAQERARAFYEKQGYTAYGDGFCEEGCPHIAMRKCLTTRK